MLEQVVKLIEVEDFVIICFGIIGVSVWMIRLIMWLYWVKWVLVEVGVWGLKIDFSGVVILIGWKEFLFDGICVFEVVVFSSSLWKFVQVVILVEFLKGMLQVVGVWLVELVRFILILLLCMWIVILIFRCWLWLWLLLFSQFLVVQLLFGILLMCWWVMCLV